MVAKWKELDLSPEKGDRGFIILDMDNDEVKAAAIRELIQANDINSIEFIVSNPTFEVWFLMHFKYTTKEYLNGDAVIRDLKKCVPGYEKNKDIYWLCRELTNISTCHGEKSCELYGITGACHGEVTGKYSDDFH